MKCKSTLRQILAVVIFLFSTFFTFNLSAQAPEGVNYQAIARDNNGNALVNRLVSVRFGIIQNNVNGTLLYEEQFDMITTNDFGLFNLEIGDGGNTGSGTLSAFDQIDWGSDSHFLKVEVDAGSGFEDLGTTQLLSVPYALYAKSAGNQLKAGDGINIRNDSIFNAGDTSNSNEAISRFELVNDSILILNEGSRVDTLDFSVFSDELIDQDLNLTENGNLRIISITGGNQIQFSVADGDSSATNEIQNLSVNTSGDSLLLSNGTGILIAELGLTDDQQLSLSGKTLDLTGLNPSSVDLTTILGIDSLNAIDDTTLRIFNANGSTEDVFVRGIVSDTSATNELIDSLRLSGKTLEAYQQGAVQGSVDLTVVLGIDSIRRFDDTTLTIFNANGSTEDVILRGIVSDTSSTNELLDSAKLVANELQLFQGLDTVLIDLSQFDNVNTDDQQLTRSNDTLFLSGDNPSFVDMSPLLGVDSVKEQNDSVFVYNHGGTIDTLALAGNVSDTSATNELVDSMRMNNGVLELYEQGNVFTVNFDTLGEVRRAFLLSRINQNRNNIDSLQKYFSLDSALTVQNRDSIRIALDSIGGHIAIDGDLSSMNERVDSMDLTASDFLRIFENGVLSDSVDLSKYTALGADTNVVAGQIVGDSIVLTMDQGSSVFVNIKSITDDITLNHDSIRIALDSIGGHIAIDGDLSSMNERVDSMDISSNDFLRIFENGTLSDSVDLSRYAALGADTNIVSGRLNGDDLELITDKGDTVKVDFTSINTGIASNQANINFNRDSINILQDSVANYENRITTNQTAINLNADSIRIALDSIGGHIAIDGDLSSMNERVDSMDLTASDFLRIFENGVLSDSVDLSKYTALGADTNVVAGQIVGDSLQLNRDQGDPVFVNITSITNAISLNRDSIRLALDSISDHIANDLDTDSLNERINFADLVGTDLIITENDSTFTIDLSGFSNQVNNDNDSDNERIDSLALSDDFLKIYEGGLLSDSISLNTFRDTAAISNLQSLINQNQTEINDNETLINNHITNDLDTDSLNERINFADLVGTDLIITENDSTFTIDLSGFSNQVNNDNDSDNERIDSLALSDDFLKIYEGGLLSDSISLNTFRDTAAISNLQSLINQNQTEINDNETLINNHITNDLDTDSLNERINFADLVGTDLIITENDSTFTIDLSGFSNQANNDNDSDNERIDSLVLSDDFLKLYEGGLLSDSISLNTFRDTAAISNLQSLINQNQTEINDNETLINNHITNDLDTDSLNERINFADLVGTDLIITENDSTFTIDLSGFSNQANNDNDSDNERIDSLVLSDDFLKLYEGGLLSDSISLNTFRDTAAISNLQSLINQNQTEINDNETLINNHITNDLDTDSLNERINFADLVGTDLIITENDSTFTIDLSGFSNTANNDNDSDNERIDSLALSDDFLKIYEGGLLSDSISLNTFRDTAAISALQTLVNQNQSDIAILASNFTADSTDLQDHLSNDNDTSMTNEQLDTVIFDNGTRTLTIRENGINYTANVPQSTVSDTNIVSGSLNGNNIELINDVGETISVDITSLNNQIATNRDSISILSDTLSYFAGVDTVKAVNDSTIHVIYDDGSFFPYQILGSKDGDKDDQNEAISSLNLTVANVLEIYEGDAIFPATIDLSSLNNSGTDNQQLRISADGDTLYLDNSTAVYLPDSSSTNELQDLGSSASGTDRTITITGGTSTTIDVADDDSDATNELNTTLELNGKDLELTDAGGTLTEDLSIFADTTSVIDTASQIRDALIDTANDIRNSITTLNAGAYKDSSATNELITNMTIEDDSLVIFENGLETARLSLDSLGAQERDSLLGLIANNESAILSQDSRISQNESDIITINGVAMQNSNDILNNQGLIGDNQSAISNNSSRINQDSLELVNHLNNDLDLDATNELNTTLELNGKDLELTDAGGTLTEDLSIFADTTSVIDTASQIRDALIDTANDIRNSITTLNAGAYKDSSATNELITNMTIEDDSLVIFENGLETARLSLDSLGAQERDSLLGLIANNESAILSQDSRISQNESDIITINGVAMQNSNDILNNQGLIGDNQSAISNNSSRINQDSLELVNHLNNDLDLDATNELNTTLELNGKDLELTDAGGTLTEDLSIFADTTSVIDTASQIRAALLDTASNLRTAINNAGDNLGNHALDSNLRLNGSYISNDGDDEGILIDNDGFIGLGTNSNTNARVAINETTVGEGLFVIQQNNSNTRAAIKGEVRGTNGSEIFALEGVAASTGSENFGLHAIANGSGTGINYGVFGKALGAATNWAGYFADGNVKIENDLFAEGVSIIDSLRINNAYAFPTDDGNSDWILKTDGAGQLEFVPASSLISSPTLNDVLLAGNDASSQSIQNLDSLYTDHLVFNRFGLNIMSLSNGDTSIRITNFGSGNPMAGLFLELDGTSSTTTEVLGVKSTVSTGANLYGGYFEADGGEFNNIGIYANAINPATPFTANYAALFDNGKVRINDTLMLVNGASNGLVLASDANGNATWQDPNSLVFDSDQQNLGSASSGPTRFITITSGTGTSIDIRDNDSDASNELQNLSINGANDSLLLSNGDGVPLSSINTAIDTFSIIRTADSSAYMSVSNSNEADIALDDTVFFKFSKNKLEFLETFSTIIGREAAVNYQSFRNTEFTAIGFQALRNNTTGSGNLAIGTGGVLMNNTTGTENTAVGHINMRQNTGGHRNSAFGTGAMDFYFNGDENTAIGQRAMENGNDGDFNTAIGGRALNLNGAGDNNVAVGYGAGHNSNGGSNNVFLGFNAGFNETTSDKLYIENSNSTTPLIYGDFAEDSIVFNGKLFLDSAKDGSGYTFPGLRGTNGQVLTSNGAGNATWQDPNTGTDNQTLSLSGTGNGTLDISNGNRIFLPDSSNINEIQTLSNVGSTYTLSDGGGSFSTDDADADNTNEAQTLSKTGSTVSLTQANGAGGGTFTDSALTSTQVLGFVAADGYLKTEVDGSVTNELNTNLELNGKDLELTDAGGTISEDLSYFADTTSVIDTANQIRDALIDTANDIRNSITTLNAGAYKDSSEVNELQSISRSGSDLTLSDGGGTVNIDDADADNTNEAQTLSKTGSTVTLTQANGAGGGTFTDSALTSTQVLGFVAADGYIKSETDDQALTISGGKGKIYLEDGGNIELNDSSATNELQSLSFVGDSIKISNGTGVHIGGIRDTLNKDISDTADALRGLITSGTSPFGTSSNVTSNENGDYANDDFVFGSPQLDDNGNTDNYSRMFFDKSKGAFRAGRQQGLEWDEDSIGSYSVAFGSNTIAKEPYSVAFGESNRSENAYTTTFGFNNTANGLASTAGGFNNTASGRRSVAMGTGNTASGAFSTAFGAGNTSSGELSTAIGGSLVAKSYFEVAIGRYNTATGPISQDTFNIADKLFVVGNGTGVFGRSDALIVYKSGNTEINGLLTLDSANNNTGYTFPGQDGTTDQILKTDGSGNLSFVDATTLVSTVDTAWNHEATQNIDLNNFELVGEGGSTGLNITNVGDIEMGGSPSTVFNSKLYVQSTTRKIAGHFQNSFTSSPGTVFGVFSRAIGNNSTANIGVYGEARNSTSNNVAIQGIAAGSSGNLYSGWFQGGKFYVSDSTGLGTGNPSARLDVVGKTTTDTLNINDEYTFPSEDGDAGYVIQTDGAGNLTWAPIDTAVCPTGMTNVAGRLCIETNERSASDWFDAAATCVGEGYKLPTWGEWYGAGVETGIASMSNSNWEWVDGGTSNTARKVGNGSLKATANDDPDSGSAAYRCILILK